MWLDVTRDVTRVGGSGAAQLLGADPGPVLTDAGALNLDNLAHAALWCSIHSILLSFDLLCLESWTEIADLEKASEILKTLKWGICSNFCRSQNFRT